mgnify:CR=1 FL=1
MGANRTKVGLKLEVSSGGEAMLMCANRTKVGLKPRSNGLAASSATGANRTKVGLKLVTSFSDHCGWPVLIEPRWD